MLLHEQILKEFNERFNWEEVFGKNSKSQQSLRNLFIKAIDQTKKETREETIREAIRKIEKIKIAVVKQTGAYKYNSCYEDCIDILNKLKK